MKKRWLKIINILLILVVASLIMWLINQNVTCYGQTTVDMVLGQDTKIISQLGPPPRVKLIDDYQVILESPVYFDLRSMPWFNQARLYLIYEEAGAELEGIAGQVGSGWSYHLQEPLLVMDLEDGIKKAVFDFDLTQVYQQKNIRRFLISTKHEEGGEFRVKSLKIILER